MERLGAAAPVRRVAVERTDLDPAVLAGATARGLSLDRAVTKDRVLGEIRDITERGGVGTSCWTLAYCCCCRCEALAKGVANACANSARFSGVPNACANCWVLVTGTSLVITSGAVITLRAGATENGRL